MGKKKKIPLKALLLAQLADIFEEISSDEFNDESANWIDIKLPNNQILCISFDKTKENIQSIEIFEEIYDVVDTKRIFHVKNKKILRSK